MQQKSVIDNKKLAAVDAWYWANYPPLMLGVNPYQMEGHEYQIDWLQCDHPHQVWKKGAQKGVTEINVIKTLHGHVHGRYPQGTLYLFPTRDDVSDFSKARFKPLIEGNPDKIGRFVQDTDANNIKKVGKSFLYFRGARSTQKIEGMKTSSSQLKSIPVDRVVFDEEDEMQPDMITLALERMSHSSIQERADVSTPTIPDFGVDALYNKSDRRVWMIKCEKCGKYTCLELEFPDCIEMTKDGKGVRLCKHCREIIHPRNGSWVAQSPGVTDLVGWWISQLNSTFVDPGKILSLFREPPNGNITEVYNSKLGMAHIEATNRLTKQDVYACCGNEPIARESRRKCAMGVDVGKILHVVIGYPEGENKYNILYVGRVEEFSDLHDLAKRFNVHCLVIDMEPETRKAREFQQEEPYKVYLCDYAENQKVSKRQDDERGIVVVKRTELCDQSHNVISQQMVVLPRRSPEIEEYAEEMSNMAKVLQEDETTGSMKYLYRKLGPDHYRHTTNYFILACQDNVVMSANDPKIQRQQLRIKQNNNWEPNRGLRA